MLNLTVRKVSKFTLHVNMLFTYNIKISYIMNLFILNAMDCYYY